MLDDQDHYRAHSGAPGVEADGGHRSGVAGDQGADSPRANDAQAGHGHDDESIDGCIAWLAPPSEPCWQETRASSVEGHERLGARAGYQRR